MRYLILLLTLTLFSAPAQANLRRTKVFIQNPTSNKLFYSHKAGGDDWRKQTVFSGYTQTFTGIDPHWVSFNNGRGRTVTYKLVGGSTNYFRWKNGALDLIRR